MNEKPIFSTENFTDLFTMTSKERAKPYRDNFKETQHMKNGKARQMNVYRWIGNLFGGNDYDNGGTYDYSYVQPSAEVVKWIAENMIQVPYDTISFKYNTRDGYTTIYAEFGQIIGSWLLAVVQSSTIKGS